MSPRVLTVRETVGVRTRLRVNDTMHELSVDSRLTLLDALRDGLGHACGHGHFSIHSWPLSPRPCAGLRVARGWDVHVLRATRHLKRAEHPAIEADTVVMII